MITLTQERLKELLHYNPDTGVFTWIKSTGYKIKIGQVAGSQHTTGYIRIKIDDVSHLAHRLAFLYMEGKFPPDGVDHINRIKHDNRWKELRHATHRTNGENRKDNTDFIGVGFNRVANKWRVYSANHKGKQKHLGMFKTHLAACYCRWANDVGQ